jgi:GT2 family glycosyltransferase
MMMLRIAVLMTSFNRREYTLRALRRLFAQTGVNDVRLTAFLVEDGCTDGTGDAVMAEFPAVRVLHGDGSLFWNRGMRMAFAAALDEGFDAYLLLNDDTMLEQDALRRLMNVSGAQAAKGVTAIVVGSTRSPETGVLSYGGICLRKRGVSAWMEKIEPGVDDTVACDTMNGNIVLIPAEIARAIGNLDGRFHHHFGDLDYGFRARRAGFAVVIAPGFLGECGTNSRQGTWRDAALPFKKRWKNLHSPKGQPFGQWVLFTRRHYGWRWPLYAVSPYVKTVLSGALSVVRGKTVRAALPTSN